jgi:hypothetical protein
VNTGKILDASVYFAENAVTGHPDRKMLLEMFGMHRETKDINVNQTSKNLTVQLIKATDEDLVSLLRELTGEGAKIEAPPPDKVYDLRNYSIEDAAADEEDDE